MFRPPSKPARRQQGAAIIVALLVVALATVLAAQLLTRINDWIDDVAVTRDQQQARELARTGLAWAGAVLIEDARSSASDTLQENWARIPPPVRLEIGEVSGRIEDLQGRFNLNCLRQPSGQIDEQALAAYRRLLAFLGLPEQLADTLADWLDADNAGRAAGDEQGVANAPLEHLDSLARVRGYDAAALQRLQAFVAVLTGSEALNLNTAPAEVLAAIQPGLSLSGAKTLTGQRNALPFRDLEDFRQRLGPSLPRQLVNAGTMSRHFFIHIEARSGLARARLSATLLRLGDGSRYRILEQNLL